MPKLAQEEVKKQCICDGNNIFCLNSHTRILAEDFIKRSNKYVKIKTRVSRCTFGVHIFQQRFRYSTSTSLLSRRWTSEELFWECTIHMWDMPKCFSPICSRDCTTNLKISRLTEICHNYLWSWITQTVSTSDLPRKMGINTWEPSKHTFCSSWNL